MKIQENGNTNVTKKSVRNMLAVKNMYLFRYMYQEISYPRVWFFICFLTNCKQDYVSTWFIRAGWINALACWVFWDFIKWCSNFAPYIDHDVENSMRLSSFSWQTILLVTSEGAWRSQEPLGWPAFSKKDKRKVGMK